MEKSDTAIFHPVVDLLLKRMETNPEEFSGDYGRWSEVQAIIKNHGSVDERRAVKAGLSLIMMNRAHELMMSDLCGVHEDKDVWSVPTAPSRGILRTMVQPANIPQSYYDQMNLYNQQAYSQGYPVDANRLMPTVQQAQLQGLLDSGKISAGTPLALSKGGTSADKIDDKAWKKLAEYLTKKETK